MPKLFAIEHQDLRVSPVMPSVNDVLRLAEATNETFSMWNDRKLKQLIIEAEHPPKNAPAYNIFWREVQPDYPCLSQIPHPN